MNGTMTSWPKTEGEPDGSVLIWMALLDVVTLIDVLAELELKLVSPL